MKRIIKELMEFMELIEFMELMELNKPNKLNKPKGGSVLYTTKQPREALSKLSVRAS